MINQIHYLTLLNKRLIRWHESALKEQYKMIHVVECVVLHSNNEYCVVLYWWTKNTKQWSCFVDIYLKEKLAMW